MRGIVRSLGLAFGIVTGSLRLLGRYPVLVVPLLPVFLLVLILEIDLLLVNNLFVGLFLVFVVAHSLMYSFAITSHMLKQIHHEKKPSLVKAITSSDSVRIIPKIFVLTVIWFSIILIIVALEMAIDAALSRFGNAGESAKRAINAAIGTVADALRMMGFMLIPIMVFEGIGLAQSFGRLKSTLKDSPITALGGLILTKVVTTLIFLVVYLSFQSIGSSENAAILLVLIGFPLLGMGWVFAMYLEQIFVTGLYLYSAFPESPIVATLLKSHLGRELPAPASPDVTPQPVIS